MPRIKRQPSATNTYHVVIKGADRQLLFEETKDYQKYLDILEYFKHECQYELFAYCLMSNHVHLLIRHCNDTPLETIFRRINTTYAVWYNMKYDRTGFVQNGRYYSEPIETETALLNVLRYIHFNPFNAGLEKLPGTTYPWSSFHEYKMKTNSLTNTNLVFSIVSDYDSFIRLHETHATVENIFFDIDQIRKRTPDDVAKDIIYNVSRCATSTEFQKLSITERNRVIEEIHKRGVSIRQINRLTGTPRGVVERIICRK